MSFTSQQISADIVHRVLQNAPIHTYSSDELARYLNCLKLEYPNSSPFITQQVPIIETSCFTSVHQLIMGHIVILQQSDTMDKESRFHLKLLGGATGHEGFSINEEDSAWHSQGWVACEMNPNRLNGSYVPSDVMQQIGMCFYALRGIKPTPSFSQSIVTSPSQRYQ